MADARGNLLGRRISPFSKRAALALGAGIVVLGVLAAFLPANAFGTQDINRLLAGFLFSIVSFLGQLLLYVVEAMIWVAQYNGFVNSSPVATGWTLVRDVANMFFIVALLVIAFGTILGSSQYNYEGKRLTTFFIMAIVVNFSRTLCGLIIDFAQVVMLTFVNGFKEAAGGNFVDALQIGNLMQTQVGGQPDAINIVISFLMALLMLGMSLLLMIVITSVLVVRIVYLWLLIVLSPIAFLARAVPFGGAQQYYGKWWGKFTNQVIVGPTLAFFLWLSLVSISSGNLASEANGFTGGLTGAETDGSLSAVFSAQALQAFIISFGLLAGGLMMAKEMSPDVGGKIADAGKGLVKSAAKRAGRATGIPAILEQRRQEREAKYQERGARMRGGFNTGLSNLKDNVAGRLLRSPAARQRMNERKMTDLNKQMTMAAQSGDSGKLAKLTKQKQVLQADMDKGPGLLGKTIGRAGDVLARSATKDRDIARKARGKVGAEEAGAIGRLSDQELKSEFDSGALPAAQRPAAALEMGKRGMLNDDESRSKARGALKGAGEGMQNQLEKIIADQNFLAAANISDADKKKRLDARELDMKKVPAGDLKNEETARMIANSTMGWQYMKDATPQQKSAMAETLSAIPENDRTAAERESLLQAQKAGGLKSSFGLGTGGSFASPELKGQFMDMLKKPGAADKLIKVEAGELHGKDGKATEAGLAVGEAVAKSPGVVNSLAQEVSRNPTEENQEALRQVLGAALAASQAEREKPEGEERNSELAALEDTLRKTRSLGSHIANLEAQGRVAPRTAEQQQESIVKIEGEIKVMDKEIGGLEKQIQAKMARLNSGKAGTDVGKVQEEVRKTKEKLQNIIEERDKKQKAREKLSRG